MALLVCKSEYQSTTISTTFRCLFSSFRKGQILIQYKDFKHGYGPGSFVALFNARMDNAARYRPEYGNRPNRCHFDPDEEFKLRNNAKPEFQIYDNFDDLMLVYHFRIAKIFMLRAQKEVR